jgi:hypothetical protein
MVYTLSVEIGDLVNYDSQRWFVLNLDRVSRRVSLLNQNGVRVELPKEFDITDPETLQVAVNPSKSWQLLTAKVKSASGPFVRMVVPGLPGRGEIVLEPWVDWIPSDPLREGGSFFVNPECKLQPGVILLATHKNGSVVRIQVPQTIGTVAKRKAAKVAANPPPRPYTRYTRIMKGFEDDNK